MHGSAMNIAKKERQLPKESDAAWLINNQIAQHARNQ
jgi:hypothetical protein